jgi:hypothetical protein
MSIFTTTNQEPTVEQVALRIKLQTAQIPQQIVRQWESVFNFLWSDGIYTAEQKIAALGTDAGELFQANEALVAFMIAQLTGKRDDIVDAINSKIAALPAYTINSDGTVTLD